MSSSAGLGGSFIAGHFRCTWQVFVLARTSAEDLKRAFLRAVAGGCTRVVMSRLVEGFVVRYCRTNLKDRALTCIAQHRAQGDRIILATASLDLYAEPLGAAIGADDVLSTRAAWSNDALTGALDGPNLKSEEKVAALKSFLAIRFGVARPDVAYSDHQSDEPLLTYAHLGVAVDPTKTLRGIAMRRGFRVEAWR